MCMYILKNLFCLFLYTNICILKYNNNNKYKNTNKNIFKKYF